MLIIPFKTSGKIRRHEIKKIFTKTEIKTLNKLIEFYDSLVISKTGGHQNIQMAYYQYIDSLRHYPESNRKTNPFFVDQESKIKFLASLNQNDLKEIFTIKDSVTYIYRRKTKTIYSPYFLSLNNQGKYVEYLKQISCENDFLKRYYELVEESGDICPVNTAMVTKLFKELNIKDKYMRLVIIVNLLIIDHPSFN